MLVVVLKAWVTETNDTVGLRNALTMFAGCRERQPRGPATCKVASRGNFRLVSAEWPIPASSLTGEVEVRWIEHCRFL
jgi:hypothetical protein